MADQHSPLDGAMNNPRDWSEDFGHENGRYMCQCFICDSTFFGHKRRVVCKQCAEPYRPQEWTKEDIDRFNAALAEAFGWKK